MFSTIKARLFTAFLLFGLLSIAAFLFSFYFIQKNENALFDFNKKLDLTYNSILKDIKITRDFFSNETINSDYFESGKSVYLDQHHKICRKINVLISSLSARQKNYGYNLDEDFVVMNKEFFKYCSMFDTIVHYIDLRGFKDHRLEGRMRSLVHELEEQSETMGMAAVLTLRKHEKDFIIRKDQKYQEKLHAQAKQILVALEKKPSISEDQRAHLIHVLKTYESKFDSLVYLDKKIGLHDQQGLKKQIDLQALTVENLLGSIQERSLEMGQNKLSSLQHVFVVIWILLILVCILFSMILSERMSRSIRFLNDKITEFVESDFTKRTILPIKESAYEVDVLMNHFSVLEQHIVNQMRTLRFKNKELEMFIYRASHDLRSPLISIRGAVNYAKASTHDRTTSDLLSKIGSVTDNFGDIVEELAMVSDIKKDNALQCNEIDPMEISRKCFNGFQSMPGFSKIVFRTEIKMKNNFYSDERFIKMILRNLIENSIKYYNPKAACPYVKVTFEEVDNKLVKIMVTDNGIGIKEELQKNVFDIFFKASETAQGSGLGLYIVQNALQKLQGAIKVKSEQGLGSAFSVYLPDATRKAGHAQRIIENKSVFPSREEFIIDYL
jgi:signal transduction histidine kinase